MPSFIFRVLFLSVAAVLSCHPVTAQYLLLEENFQAGFLTALGFGKQSDTLINIRLDNKCFLYSIKTRTNKQLTGQWEHAAVRQILTSSTGNMVFRSANRIFALEFTTGLGFGSIDCREECHHCAFIPFSNTLFYAAGHRIHSWNTISQARTEVYADDGRKTVRRILPFVNTPAMLVQFGEGSLEIIHHQTKKLLAMLPARYGSISALALSADDRYLAIGNTSGTVFLRDLKTEQDLWQEALHTHQVSELAFAPQGAFLLSRSFDQTFKLTQVTERKLLFAIQLEGAINPLLAVSSDGRYVAVNKNNVLLQVYNLRAMLADWQYDQAMAAYQMKQYQQVVEMLSQVLRDHPVAKAYSLRGKAFYALNQADRALADLNEAIRLNHNHPDNFLLKATILFGQSKYKDALTDVDKSLTFAPADTIALSLKVRTLTALGDYRQAGEIMTGLLPRIKNKTALLEPRVSALMHLRQYRDAISELDILIRTDPKPVWYQKRGQCHYFLGEYQQAADDLFRQNAGLTENPSLLKFRAYTAFALENYEQAIPMFQALTGGKHKDPELISGLAFCYLASGRDDQLEKTFRDVAEMPDVADNVWFIRILQRLEKKEYQGVFEDVKKIFSQKPAYRFSLGDSLKLNMDKPYQKVTAKLADCICDKLAGQKPDLSAQAVGESLAGYRNREVQAQRTVNGIMEDCQILFRQLAKQEIEKSRVPAKLSITRSGQFDQASGRYQFMVGDKSCFISGIDQAKGLMLEKEWRRVTLFATQRLSDDLKTWQHSGMKALLPYSYDTLVVQETGSEKVVAATGPGTAATKGQQTSRGTEPISPVKREIKTEHDYHNYLLLIAVDNYQHWPKLKSAVRDARSFARVLLDRYDFDSLHMYQLFNEDVTKGNVYNTIARLSKIIGRKDRLVIYYAGHGDTTQAIRDYYWVPYDGKLNAQYDYISNSDLRTWIGSINPLHTVLFSDACFAGLITSRASGEENITRSETMPSRFVLASGMHDEQVKDQFLGTNHSPFAYYLIKYLEGNEEARVSVYKVATFVQERVIDQTGGQQNPEFSNMPDFPDSKGQFYFHLKK